jgi:hypothetical protein
MFTLGDLWAGIALPLGLAAAGLLAARWLTRHRLGARASRSWGGPLAVALGFAGGIWALFGWPGFPPLDANDWLLFLALPLSLLGTLDASARLPMQVRLAASTVAVVGVLLLVSWPVIKDFESSWPDGTRAVAVTCALSIAWIFSLDELAARRSAAGVGALLLATLAPAAAVLALSGSQRLAQTSGVLAAAVGGWALAEYALGAAGVAAGIPLIVGSLHGGVLLCGTLYASLSLGNLALLLAAVHAAWLVQRWVGQPWVGRQRGILSAVVQAALVAAVSCWALARAWLAFDAGGY